MRFINILLLILSLFTLQVSAQHKDTKNHNHKSIEAKNPYPSVDIKVIKDAKSGYNIQLVTKNFKFTPEKVNKENVMNEGHAHIYINGNKNRSSDKILELYDLAINKVEERETAISILKLEIDSLKLDAGSNKTMMDLNSFSTLSKDAKIQFTELRYFGYSNMLISSDFRTIDTVTVVKTQWDSSLVDSLVEVRVDSLKIWLKSELEIENLEVDW